MDYGETGAIRAMNLRVPGDAPQRAKDLAGEALETIVKVMRGEIKGFDAPLRRASAKDIREEICGAIKQKIEHSGLESLTDEQLEARREALLAKRAAQQVPQEAAPTESAVASEGAELGLEGVPE